MLTRLAGPFRRSYQALPAERRKAADKASKAFGLQVSDLYVGAVEASKDWPLAWRQALVASLPAAADFTDPAKRAQAFRARIGEVTDITNRARAAAKKLYGLGMHDPDAALESAAKADPKYWQQIQHLIAQHIVKRSPATAVSEDLLNALADEDEATRIDSTIVDRPPASGQTPLGHLWAPVVRKLRDEAQARQRAQVIQ